MDCCNFCLPMWEPLQRYKALPKDARKLFRRAVILGPMISLVLRFRGYRKTQNWLQQKLDLQAIVGPETREASTQVEMTCRMVRAAEHYAVARVTCLEESLLLSSIAAKSGNSCCHWYSECGRARRQIRSARMG